MSKVEQAVGCFKQGFNCSQAVISTYGPQSGLDRELALKVASGFGGGIGGQGETCGAVTGALMAIGLKYGGATAEDAESRKKARSLVSQFLKKFKARNGSTLCRELLGGDISTPQGRKAVEEKGLHDRLCPNYVRAAAEILEELL